MLALAALLSVLVGVTLGLLGGGGSILTVPILVYVLRLEPHAAIATSLVVVGVTSAAAVVPHARRGHVRWRTALAFGVAGMTGSFVAGRFARHVPDALLLGLFATTMLVTAIAMLRRRPPRTDAAPRGPEGAPAPRTEHHALLRLALLGLGTGTLTGLVGAGGGFLIVPALVVLARVPIEEAIGTSLAVIVLHSSAGLLGHLGDAAIDWRIAALVSAAAVAGSVVGGTLSGRVAPNTLRRAFAWLVVAMAIFVLGEQLPRLWPHAT